jgi:hypothetical protein
VEPVKDTELDFGMNEIEDFVVVVFGKEAVDKWTNSERLNLLLLLKNLLSELLLLQK